MLDFNAFRRQYYKARDAYRDHAEAGSSQVTYRSERGGPLEHELEVGDAEAATRLAVLMRPFLSPESPLYLDTLLEEMEAESVPVNQEAIEKLREDLEKARQSQPRVIYNDEELTPEKIYKLVSQGGFFVNDDQAVEQMEELRKGPLHPMVWFQFLGYVERHFRVVHNIWLTLRDADPLPRPDHHPPLLDEDNYQCIYCRSTSGPFEGQEHHVPEVLGNYFETLPQGYVCDECNNGVLAQLDRALAEFGPLVPLRVWAVPYTKDGSLPAGDVEEAQLEKTAPRQLEIEWKQGSGPLTEGSELAGFSGRLNPTMTDAAGLSPKTIGRALFKMALGVVAYREGHDAVLDPFYDPAREFVVEGRDWGASLIVLPDCRPHGQIEFRIQGDPSQWIYVNLFGLRFVFSLREADYLDSSKVYSSKGRILFPEEAAAFRMEDGVDWSNIES